MAAVGCAEGECAPPPELVMSWECKQFHCLPESGGLLDQPAGLVAKMRATGNVYDAWIAWKACPPAELPRFKQASASRWNIIQQILDWRTDGTD